MQEYHTCNTIELLLEEILTRQIKLQCIARKLADICEHRSSELRLRTCMSGIFWFSEEERAGHSGSVADSNEGLLSAWNRS
jgi:hypothetical protein